MTNKPPNPPPDYSQYCDGCKEGHEFFEDLWRNGKFTHQITSKETRPCDASDLRAIYRDYLRKYIYVPPILFDKKD